MRTAIKRGGCRKTTFVVMIELFCSLRRPSEDQSRRSFFIHDAFLIWVRGEETSTPLLESICLHPLTATAAFADQKTTAHQLVDYSRA